MIIEMRSRGPLLLAGDNLCRLPLERDVLPDYLKARRWFDSKADAAPSVTIEKSLALADLADAAILILGVKSKTRTAGSYLFPVRTLWECERPRAGLVCELRSGPAAGWLVDGFSDDRFVRELLERIRRAGESPETADGLVFRGSAALPSNSGFAESEIVRPGAEQSNTSVIADGVILKAFRRLEPGIHPELEMGRYLTEKTRFGNVPKLLGSIEYVCPSAGSRTALCVLQGLIENAKDGWQHVTNHLKRLNDGAPAGRQSEHGLVLLAQQLGKRTAELHQALGAATDNPDFESEPASADWLLQWQADLLNGISSVTATLASRRDLFSDAHSALADRLMDRADELAARVGALFPKSTEAQRTRLHGDFHLGQILVRQGEVFIVDFEGEPMRPLAERRGKFLPLRDVAGMLRSFDYAGASAARDAESAGKAPSFLQEVTGRLQSHFLMAYGEAIAGCVSFPADLTQADDLLELCVIEKALYEVHYEIANRPAWIDIPIVSLLATMDGKKHGFLAPEG